MSSAVEAASAAAAAAAAAFNDYDYATRHPGVSGGGGGGRLLPPAPASDPAFERHVDSLRATMFYVCQGSCLCGTVNNRGKVIYCYGDLVPRHGELFAEGGETNNGTSSKELLAAQLAVWVVGLLAILIVLILIRKSIASLRLHLEHLTERLPVYHDDEAPSSASPGSSPGHQKSETGVDGAVTGPGGVTVTGVNQGAADGLSLHHEDPHHHDAFSDDGTLTPDPLTDESPIHIGMQRLAVPSKGVPVEQLKKMRLQRKDFKKGGEALRGKNVTENFRVKEKDIKRTMK